MPETDAWDVPSTPNVAAVSGALGGPAAPTPLGGPSPDVMARLWTRERPVAVAATEKPTAPDPTPAAIFPWQKAAPAVQASIDGFLSQVAGPESGNSTDYTLQNPSSSASGPVQITKGTYVPQFRKLFPDQAKGMLDEQIWSTRLNPDTYKTVAHGNAWDNFQGLSSSGIAPSLVAQQVAWRAGLGGAKAIFGAARENPSALIKDVAPDLATPGNGNIGNLTVGQFLTNPYQRGQGSPDSNAPSALYALNLGQQILQQDADFMREGRAKIAKIDKDYKPVDVPPLPKPPDTDPLKTFGSLAGVFATLAAGFSRTPATAALNGLAGAMDASKKNDWEGYKANYDQYKTQSELAIKTQEMHSKNIHDALEEMQTNMSAGHTMLTAALTLANDEENLKHLHLGEYLEIGRRNDEINKNMQEQQLQKPVRDASIELTAANHGYESAVQSGDQEQISAWAKIVKEKHDNLDRAASGLSETQRALSGTGSTAQIKTPQWGTYEGKRVLGTFDPTSNQYLAVGSRSPMPGFEPEGKSGKETDAEVLARKAFVDTHDREPDLSNLDDKAELAKLTTKERQATTGGLGGEQFRIVLDGVKRDKPDLPADQQELLAKQRLAAVSGQASRAPIAQYIAGALPQIMAESGISEPEARLEAARRWRMANQVPSGNQRLRIEERVGMFDESNKEIDKAIDMLEKHVALAGLGGRGRRLTETVGNVLGSNTTSAADFRSEIQLLQLWADRLLTHSDSRPLAAEKANISGIVRGLEAGDTTANTLSSMKKLKDIYGRLKALDERELGAAPTPVPANTQTISPASNAPWSADPITGGR